VMSLLEKVRIPTLVMHSRDDNVISITEGRILAAGIRNAQFIELDSKNHVLLDTEPAWKRFCDEILEFTGIKGSAHSEDRRFRKCTDRRTSFDQRKDRS
jgi:pimeloyl-ACP methyl ester carboxylesterase